LVRAPNGFRRPQGIVKAQVSGRAPDAKTPDSKGANLAAQVTGSKTVTRDASPNATATVLTALLATPIENLTISQFQMLADVLRKMSGGAAPGKTIGSLLN
jgi:hypothetical protein